jgi:hypothetical protein
MPAATDQQVHVLIAITGFFECTIFRETVEIVVVTTSYYGYLFVNIDINMQIRNLSLSLRNNFTNFLFLILTICMVSHPLAYASNIKITPKPDWVKDTTVVDSFSFNNEALTTGYYYLMLNYQENLKTKQYFRHKTVKLLNSEGVQEMSDLSISYDPSYQTLYFHSLIIIRNGHRINKLNLNDVKIIQREENMDRYLYDGMLTAVVNLTDIRIGDIIDYSYSICGDNPIFKGVFTSKTYLQYVMPVEFLNYTIIIPEKRKLRFKYKNGAPQPMLSKSNGLITYSWKKLKVQALVCDRNTPSWYDPYPYVSISEYDSWGEIVEQFAPLYSISTTKRTILKQRLRKNVYGASEDSIVIQAIRFVQDHIRYLGFEDGLNSHKPADPLTLLNQRFGDCKAKSFLLCEILKSHKIDAFPVLVNTYDSHSMNEDLPSPDHFNHCTVQYSLHGRVHYVDPTRSCQGGNLNCLYYPDYRFGLILKEGNNSIDSLPYNNYYKVNLTETFNLDTIDGGAEFNVVTRYTGGAADHIRSTFFNTSRESLEKDYVDYYSKLYPAIKAVDSFKVTDLRGDLNEFIVEEHYQIDSLWQMSDTVNDIISADFYPLSIDSYVSGQKSPKRTMPYSVSFPVCFEQRTVINLPEEWAIENDSADIRAKSFTYNYSKQYSNQCITITHKYRTFQDYVSASESNEFISKHNAIMDKLPFSLTYNKSVASRNNTFKFSWVAAICSIILISLLGFIAVKLYFNYDTGAVASDSEALEIGGWLILFGIGLVFSPFKMLFDLYHAPSYMNDVIWSSLFDFNNSSKHMLLGIVMVVELIFNCFQLVFLTLILVLFFKRRTLFPPFAIAFYVMTLAFLIADTWVVSLLSSTKETFEDQKDTIKDITRGILSAVIWVPYLLLSKRVKQTFILRAPENCKIPD